MALTSMGFSYDNALRSIEQETNALVESHRDDLSGKETMLKERLRTLLCGNSLDPMERVKMRMLYEISFGTFWSAATELSELDGISRESRVLYARVLMEQANRSEVCWEPYCSGYKYYPHALIVEIYDTNRLEGSIPEDLIKESVTKGFFELANLHFIKRGTHLGYTTYRTLMKYAKYLDLTRAEEFLKGPLVAGGWFNGNDWNDTDSWIIKEYVDTFKRNEPNLRKELASKLAAPIIQDIFRRALAYNPSLPRDSLESALAPYKEYIKEPPVQELLVSDAKITVKAIDADYGKFFIKNLEVYFGNMTLTDCAKAMLVSSNLKAGHETLVSLEFPLAWLTEDKLKEIADKIMSDLETLSKAFSRPYKMQDKRMKDSLKEGIPHVKLVQEAMSCGLLPEKQGRVFLERELSRYLSHEGARPPIQITRAWERTEIDQKYVDPKLYTEFRTRTSKDLLHALRGPDQRRISEYATKTF